MNCKVRFELSIETQWASAQKRLIRIHYHKGWRWQDFKQNVEITKEMIRSVDYEVPALVEFDEDASFPPLGAFRHITQIQYDVPQNMGLVVVVTENPLWVFLLRTLKLIIPDWMGYHYVIVKSSNEAWELLHTVYGDNLV